MIVWENTRFRHFRFLDYLPKHSAIDIEVLIILLFLNSKYVIQAYTTSYRGGDVIHVFSHTITVHFPLELHYYGHQWAKKFGFNNKVTVLTRESFERMYRCFCEVAKKSGHNNEVTV